jgi:DNA-binding response OmpR family regulator
MENTVFCPYCDSTQPRYEYREGDRVKLRCQRCGCPVDEKAVETETATFNRAKVLCIDDDRLLLALFADTLTASAYTPLTATDGPSGIDLAKKERPDLIILDVMMPKVSGFEVCRRMRADPDLQHTPIIIVTAMHDPNLNIKGFEAGANLAMQKPFSSKELIKTVKTALALKAKRSAT